MKNTNQQRWLSLAFISLSLLIISLDNTILNVALPVIAEKLGAGITDLQWIVDAYVLVFASLLLTMGSTGDRVGRKKTLQVGLAVFGLGSLAAGLSRSSGMLIAMRAFMGIGAAMIMPATLSILTATFRAPKERARAISIWASVAGLGIGLGPVAGGWLLSHFSWGSVFFVNIPIVVIAIIGDRIVVQDSRDENAPKPDIPGVVLSVAGLFALVYGIIKAGTDGWTATNVLAAFAVAAVLLSAFGWWEGRTRNPMLPVRFFRNMSFTGANVSLVLTMFCMFGAIFFLSQYFQSVQGYSPLATGLRLLPMSAVVIPATIVSARVAEHLGIKFTVGIGLLIAAGGMLFMSRMAAVDTPYGTVLIGLCLTGFGIGLTWPSATTSVMGSIPVSKAGIGSSMNDTTRQIGGSLGVAVLGTIVNSVYLGHIRPLLDVDNPVYSGLPAGMAQLVRSFLTQPVQDAIKSGIQGAHVVAARIPVPQVAQELHDQASLAFVSGISDALMVTAVVLLAASLFAFAILPGRIRRPEGDETKDLDPGPH
jgi:EmrB/QacA subfamily drug resistance transporter